MTREELYKMMTSLSKGKHFDSGNYDEWKVAPCIICQVVPNIELINTLYLGCRKLLHHGIIRNPSGSIKRHQPMNEVGCYDFQEVKTISNILKGIRLTVILYKTIFVFKFGRLTAKEGSKIYGFTGFEAFKKELEADGINIQDYKLRGLNEGLTIKEKIEDPIINIFVRNKEFKHVNHLDLNQAWPSQVAKRWPEMKPAIERCYKKDKLLMDVCLGYMQSPYTDYEYAEISKTGINETNKKIWSIVDKMLEQQFQVIAINTDGIWYRDTLEQGRLYHDEEEGEGLGHWRHDYIDCIFYGEGQASYYFIDNINGTDKINIRLRGNYSYEDVKPRSEWNSREDFFKAKTTLITLEWDEKKGFIYHDYNY